MTPLIRLLLLIAAIVCAVWAVLITGPAPDFPGNALQMVAASLAFGWASFLPERAA